MIANLILVQCEFEVMFGNFFFYFKSKFVRKDLGLELGCACLFTAYLGVSDEDISIC